MSKPGRGRRPRDANTEAQIRCAALMRFADKGYARTSIRDIARDAAVDPKLVHYYFGNKQALFHAVSSDPCPIKVPTGIDGAALVRRILAYWDEPKQRLAMLARLRATLDDAPLEGAWSGLDGRPDPTDRDALPTSTLASIEAVLWAIAVGRYVARFEPIASATADEVAALYGHTLDAFLGRST